MEKIKPKTIKEEYELEDRDYLLIQALRDLTIEIHNLNQVMRK